MADITVPTAVTGIMTAKIVNVRASTAGSRKRPHKVSYETSQGEGTRMADTTVPKQRGQGQVKVIEAMQQAGLPVPIVPTAVAGVMTASMLKRFVFLVVVSPTGKHPNEYHDIHFSVYPKTNPIYGHEIDRSLLLDSGVEGIYFYPYMQKCTAPAHNLWEPISEFNRNTKMTCGVEAKCRKCTRRSSIALKEEQKRAQQLEHERDEALQKLAEAEQKSQERFIALEQKIQDMQQTIEQAARRY